MGNPVLDIPIRRSTRRANDIPAPVASEVPPPQAASRGPTRLEHRQTGSATQALIRVIVNTVATFVLAGIVGLCCLAVAPRALGFDSVVVGSGSMRPSLYVGDVVVLAAPTDSVVGPGSVINYTFGGATRLHRVVGVTADGYQTKGDANLVADSGTVYPEAVTGLGIYVVPFIGWPRQWFATGHWVPLGATLVVVLAMLRAERWSSERPAHRARNSNTQPHVIYRVAVAGHDRS